MSLALVHSRARAGVKAQAVRIEVFLSGGLPHTQIVGLPAAAVRESRDRVRAALICARFEFPQRRITINLAPADLPKEGGRFDLAIMSTSDPKRTSTRYTELARGTKLHKQEPLVIH